MKYEVKREHYGDKNYTTGDVREANPNDVRHLVEKGVLVEVTEKETKTVKPTAKKVKQDDQSSGS